MKPLKVAAVAVPVPGKEAATKGKSAAPPPSVKEPAAAAAKAPAKPVATALAKGKEAATKAGKATTNGVPKIKPILTPAAAQKPGTKPAAAAKGPLKPIAAVEAAEGEKPSGQEEKGKIGASLIAGIQSSVLEGEEWRVTISSKHELLTSSDPDNRTVIIRPKTPPKEEKKAAVKAAKAAAVKSKEKKITFEKKIHDARSGKLNPRHCGPLDDTLVTLSHHHCPIRLIRLIDQQEAVAVGSI